MIGFKPGDTILVNTVWQVGEADEAASIEKAVSEVRRGEREFLYVCEIKAIVMRPTEPEVIRQVHKPDVPASCKADRK